MARNAAALPGSGRVEPVAQSFIRSRSRRRWLAHQLVFWGCILAALVTFPLVFGLLHFESVGQNGREYRAFVGEVGTFSFDSRSVVGWVIFHLLDISAVLVLAGVFIFLGRRLRDPGALAVERSNDFLALAGLFAVSVTGLALTASNLWMEGRFYVFLNTVHALTVILGLMYIPFGKLFHIFQRPANLGVAYYKREGAAGAQQHCVRCGEPFASQLQMDDLKEVLPQVGFDYSIGRRRQLPGPLPAVPPPPGHPGPVPSGRRVRLMARPPVTEDELVARYGPHLNQAPPGGWNAGIDVDREVKTHCCFCGQQCGIMLKVKDDEVVGFEPWYEFPFNEGKLCPKGVKRYLQNAHPDRLLEPLERDPAAPGGFRHGVVGPRARPHGGARSAASRTSTATDAFAMLSGVSLDNEKSYLIGKFARLGARHRQPRLQRPALHGVGRRGQQAGARHRPGVQPLERHPAGRGRVRRPAPTSPSARRSPPARSGGPATTGAKLIVADPRVTPIARTADLFLGLRPGTDSALLGAMLHVLIERDWLDHDFIDDHTDGLRGGRRGGRATTRRRGRERITGVPAARIEQAAEWWGTSQTGMLLHARGIEHHTKGVENVWACINLGLATGKYGKPGCGVTHHHRAGQRPGRPRARPQVRPAPRQPRHHQPRAPRLHRVGVGLRRRRDPRQGPHRPGDRGGDPPRRDQGPAVDLLQPGRVAARHRRFTKEALDKLEFYAVIDFFLSETAFHADVVLPGSLHEEDEGTSTSVEGRVIKLNPSKPPPGNARLRLGDPLRPRRAGSARADYFPYTERRGDLRGAPGGVEGRQRRLLRHHLGADRARARACSGPARPRTTRAPSGSSRAAASTPTTAGAGSTRSATGRRPRWSTTTTRCGSPPAGSSASTCRAPRPGASARWSTQYPEPLCEMHPRLAEQHGIADRRRRAGHLPAGVDDAAGQGRGHHPARHGLHPVPLGRATGGQPAHQPGARPAVEDPRVQGVRRADRAGRPRRRSTTGRWTRRPTRDDGPRTRSEPGRAADDRRERAGVDRGQAHARPPGRSPARSATASS